eukprot:m.122527 g.122527  ORF g.122527 m.122527 type:complete len:598 (-) comp21960_c0_seq1:106-1899(-)
MPRKAANKGKRGARKTPAKNASTTAAPGSPASGSPKIDDESASGVSPSGRSKRSTRKPRTPYDDGSAKKADAATAAGAASSSPTKKGVVYADGNRIDAQDYLGSWYPARIIEVNEPAKKALVHFERWNKRFDEWFEFGSPRIRPFGSGTEKGGENAGATTASGRPSRAKRGGVASPVLNDTPEPDAAHRRHKSGGSSPSVRSGSTSPKLIPTPASLLADTAAASADASGAASDASAHVCPEPDCSKSFRKAALLDSHMRHYHGTDPDATGSTATSPGPTPTTQRRKRPSSDDEEAESDAPVRHDLRQKSKRARVDPPFDEDELSTDDFILALPVEDAGAAMLSEADQLGPEGSVTQCLCGFNDESEYMIQCERCSAWQHVDCVGIRAGEEPDRYHCFGCVKLLTVLEQDLSGTRWLRLGRKRIDDVPILPTSAKDINWSSETLDHVLEPRGRKVTADGDPAHVQQLLMTQRNIGCDLSILERCLRALRLSLNKLGFQSSDASLKKRMGELEQHQNTIEYHINAAVLDMDTLDAVVQALVAHDKVNLCARVAKAPVGAVPEPSMSRQRAITRMQELYTKYNQRQWKTYVVTAEGRVLR